MKWYEQAVFYEVYVPSFKDGNEDGIGDFKGIISKLSYLKELGVTGIWLTPIFPSPKVDNGYDISDYYQIAPEYGDLSDFKLFLKMAHELGMKVIMDLVLNHTSDQHEWFKEARRSKDNPYRDYYIWRAEIPNNWESFFSGSAWEYDELTDEYYYHAFAKEQVDLNWSNPKVKEEMFKVVEFWLNQGVDGFRLDVINFLKTDESAFLRNNPFNEDGKQIHQYDKDQIKTLAIIQELRQFADQWEDKYLLGEVGSDILEELMPYVGENYLNSVFNFNLGSIPSLKVSEIFREIMKMDEFKLYPTLFFSSHDMSRHMSRLCDHDVELAKVMATLILMLKGIPFLYQGDEIGMHDLVASEIDEMNDIQARLTYQTVLESGKGIEEALNQANESCRDKSRSPIQWNSSRYAGFSNHEPWLNVAQGYESINVQYQLQDSQSLFKVYQKLIRIRMQYPHSTDPYLSLRCEGNVIRIQKQLISGIMELVFCFGESVMIEFEALNFKKLIYSTKNREKVEKQMRLSREALIFLQQEA